MISVVERAPARASVGYLLSIAGGCLALTFTVLALGGMWEGYLGHNPLDAMEGIGLAGFIFSYAPAFVMRLIFWPKASASWKAAARLFITLFFLLSLLATMVALVLLVGPIGAKGGEMSPWSIVGALCQIGAVVWLLRYRRI